MHVGSLKGSESLERDGLTMHDARGRDGYDVDRTCANRGIIGSGCDRNLGFGEAFKVNFVEWCGIWVVLLGDDRFPFRPHEIDLQDFTFGRVSLLFVCS